MRTFEVENLIYLHMSIIALIELHMRCAGSTYPICRIEFKAKHTRVRSLTHTHTFILNRMDI